MDALKAGRPMVLIDVIGGSHPQTIPGAVPLPFAGNYGQGSFDDETQALAAKAFNDVLQGRGDVPVIVFCQGVRYWGSDNAILRARAAGIRNLAWYRGAGVLEGGWLPAPEQAGGEAGRGRRWARRPGDAGAGMV